jgi:hypothetical protein
VSDGEDQHVTAQSKKSVKQATTYTKTGVKSSLQDEDDTMGMDAL